MPHVCRGAFISLVAGLASLTGSVAVMAEPPAPTALFPMGGGRDQTVAVTAEGKLDAWPVKVWASSSDVVVEPAEKKGELSVRIAEDATPGLHWIRLYDDSGASGLLPFEVGTLSSIVEVEPNDDPANANKVEPFPAVIDGRLAKSGDVDGYAVTLVKGQTLVASLAGQRLGSPMDAVLQIATPDGFVVQQNDDQANLDPQIVLEAPRDGDYIVRCFAFPAEPNSTIGFAGGDRYVYRLTLTTGGFLDHTRPLVVAEQADEVHPVGWNLPDDAAPLLIGPSSSGDRVRVWHPELAGHAELPVLPYSCTDASDADSVAHGDVRTLSLPVSVSGRLQDDGDRDRYQFTAKKGDTWSFRLLAGSLASSLNPVLQISDATGKALFENDATGKGGRDVEHRLNIPNDGDYLVSVFDLAERGGLRNYYRLDIAQPVPEFQLTLTADRFAVAPDKPATLEVTVVRKNGFQAPVELTIDGLPENVSAPSVKNEIDADAKPEDKEQKSTVKLTLSVADSAAAWSGPIRVIGRSPGDDAKPSEQTATIDLSISRQVTSQPWLTVSPAAK